LDLVFVENKLSPPYRLIKEYKYPIHGVIGTGVLLHRYKYPGIPKDMEIMKCRKRRGKERNGMEWGLKRV
jgi:hypothetical protein